MSQRAKQASLRRGAEVACDQLGRLSDHERRDHQRRGGYTHKLLAVVASRVCLVGGSDDRAGVCRESPLAEATLGEQIIDSLSPKLVRRSGVEEPVRILTRRLREQASSELARRDTFTLGKLDEGAQQRRRPSRR